MMNSKGELTIQSMMIGIAGIGLFLGIIALSISSMGGSHDITGYESSDLETYTLISNNLSEDVQEINEDVDEVTLDPNVFDYFAGIFKAILTPFKFAYRSFTGMIQMVTSASSTFNVFSVVKEFLITMIIIMVVVGLVLVKHYRGRSKN
jgi:hypothetical protein